MVFKKLKYKKKTQLFKWIKLQKSKKVIENQFKILKLFKIYYYQKRAKNKKTKKLNRRKKRILKRALRKNNKKRKAILLRYFFKFSKKNSKLFFRHWLTMQKKKNLYQFFKKINLKKKKFISFFKKELKYRVGLEGTETQIQPIILKSSLHALTMSQNLQRIGFDVRAIRPPTVQEGTARLRVSLTLNATDKETISFVEELDKQQRSFI